MSATVSQGGPKVKAPAQRQAVLPPARGLARNARPATTKLRRQGGPKDRDSARERFALPEAERRPVALRDPVQDASPAVTITTSQSPANIIANNLVNDDSKRSLTIARNPTASATIQFVEAPAEVAPPTITLGRPSSPRNLKHHTVQKLESTTITSTGAPLPVAVKNPLTRSFSIDLTPIRVHTDARAQHTVRSFNTRAFAYGHNIFLGPGESPSDLRLMAHEVAHVV
jgi:hypothetical protein